MHRFWVTLYPQWEPSVLNLGLGVTAYSEEDARKIVAEALGLDREIKQIEIISDMRLIEQHHVAPNIGDHFVRGIWFPLGYQIQPR